MIFNKKRKLRHWSNIFEVLKVYNQEKLFSETKMKSRIFKGIKVMNIYFQYTGTKINTKESPKMGKNHP